jgi:hypothetical protein
VKIDQIIEAGIDAGEFRTMEPLVASSCIFGGAIRMVQLRLDGLIKRPLPELLEQTVTGIFAGVCVAEDSANAMLGDSLATKDASVIASIAV